MKKRINRWMIALWAIAAVSCSEERPGGQALTGDTELRIVPQVTGAVETRAVVAGEKFGAGARVGLQVEASGQTLNSMYNNFYASPYGTSGWSYFLNGVNVGTKLSGFASWSVVTVSGYYPYNPEVTDFGAIPFHIADADGATTSVEATTDYMVAGSKLKSMHIPGEVTLQFEHLMTYIYLYFTRTYQGPALILSKVTLEMDNGREFVVAGTYNAATVPDVELNETAMAELIVSTETSPRLEITTNHTIPTSVNSIATIPLVIMPQLLAAGGDATITATFYFTEPDGVTPFKFDDQGNPKMTFALSGVTNAVGGAGFQRGKQYQLTATLGTYIHFDGVPVVDDRPMDEDTEDAHIDI